MTREGLALTRGQFLKLSAAALAGATLGEGGDAPCRRAWGSAAGIPSEGPADVVLRNGRVATMDGAGTIAEAVAILDGLVVRTGSDRGVSTLIGPWTRVVDLGGRTVTPGLVDAHCHLQLVGLMNGYYVPFLPPAVTTMAELQEALADLLAATPTSQWTNGYYLSVAEGRFPTRADLDPVSPQHPVWLMQQAGHVGSANSRAMELAGITAATPDPDGGVIERDASGEPTGVFYNHRAMDLLRRVIPRYTDAMVEDSILSSLPLFVAQGITSFHDNNIRLTETIRTYQELAQRNSMQARGLLYYTLEWPQDLQHALDDLGNYQDPFSRLGGFKFLIDGQAPTFYCHQAHGGSRWDMPTWDPDQFKQIVRTLHDTGLQICVHCGGDAAVDLVLDAYEEAMNANPRPDPRHRVEHGVVTTPEATQRMRDLGVVVCTQPQFIRMSGDYYRTVLTAEQCARVIMTREWLEAGVNVALGSDAPTTPWLAPGMTLAAAVSRRTATDQVMGADQVMTNEEALRAHTVGAAYAGHDESSRGSLEAGKLADLVVWATDLLTASPRDLYYATVDLTMVDGRVVYQAPALPRRPVGRVRP